MTSISFFEEQYTPDITHTSTKLRKLITVLPILYYFQILSQWIQFKCNLRYDFKLFTIRGTC